MSKKDNLVNLCFVTDRGYAMPTCVTLTSILQNKKPTTIYNVYVLYKGLSDEEKQKFLELNNADSRIFLIDLSNQEDYSRYKIDGIPATPTSIYKFLIPDILSDIGKVLFLDGDIIVRNDLTDLFNYDIKNKYIAAALNADGADFARRINYFNSGVMLMNLALMRKHCISKKLIDYRMNGYNDYMDQDALNAVCRGKILFLPFKYNTQINAVFGAFIRRSNADSKICNLPYIWNAGEDDTTMVNILEHAEIIHYTSAKPFKHFDCLLAGEWFKYYNVSPYRDLILRNISSYHIDQMMNSVSWRIGQRVLSPWISVKKYFLAKKTRRVRFLRKFYENFK